MAAEWPFAVDWSERLSRARLWRRSSTDLGHADRLAAEPARERGVCAAAELRGQAAQDELGVGDRHAADEPQGFRHAAGAVRREQHAVAGRAHRGIGGDGLLREDVDAGLDAAGPRLAYQRRK